MTLTVLLSLLILTGQAQASMVLFRVTEPFGTTRMAVDDQGNLYLGKPVASPGTIPTGPSYTYYWQVKDDTGVTRVALMQNGPAPACNGKLYTTQAIQTGVTSINITGALWYVKNSSGTVVAAVISNGTLQIRGSISTPASYAPTLMEGPDRASSLPPDADPLTEWNYVCARYGGEPPFNPGRGGPYCYVPGPHSQGRFVFPYDPPEESGFSYDLPDSKIVRLRHHPEYSTWDQYHISKGFRWWYGAFVMSTYDNIVHKYTGAEPQAGISEPEGECGKKDDPDHPGYIKYVVGTPGGTPEFPLALTPRDNSWTAADAVIPDPTNGPAQYGTKNNPMRFRPVDDNKLEPDLPDLTLPDYGNDSGSQVTQPWNTVNNWQTNYDMGVVSVALYDIQFNRNLSLPVSNPTPRSMGEPPMYIGCRFLPGKFVNLNGATAINRIVLEIWDPTTVYPNTVYKRFFSSNSQNGAFYDGADPSTNPSYLYYISEMWDGTLYPDGNESQPAHYARASDVFMKATVYWNRSTPLKPWETYDDEFIEPRVALASPAGFWVSQYSPCPYRYDDQGVISEAPGPYDLTVQALVNDPGYWYDWIVMWTAPSSIGTLDPPPGTQTLNPTHHAPSVPGSGTLTVELFGRLTEGGTYTSYGQASRLVAIYGSHLDRDRANFKDGYYSGNFYMWDPRANSVPECGTIDRFRGLGKAGPFNFNSHSAVSHAYNGTLGNSGTLSFSQTPPITEQWEQFWPSVYDPAAPGDVCYYTNEDRSVTVVSWSSPSAVWVWGARSSTLPNWFTGTISVLKPLNRVFYRKPAYIPE